MRVIAASRIRASSEIWLPGFLALGLFFYFLDFHDLPLDDLDPVPDILVLLVLLELAFVKRVEAVALSEEHGGPLPDLLVLEEAPVCRKIRQAHLSIDGGPLQFAVFLGESDIRDIYILVESSQGHALISQILVSDLFSPV